MNRRQFLSDSALSLGAGGLTCVGTNSTEADTMNRAETISTAAAAGQQVDLKHCRGEFVRLQREVFLSAAAGTPLGSTAEKGLRRFEEYWRLGPDDGRSEYFSSMLTDVRARFARLIGAVPEEIAFVPNTKAGEQTVLDGLSRIAAGGNVVTNDLHFTGSLHNLLGLKANGLDVRIVKSQDWQTDLPAMLAAIDDNTALVTVSLVSNINGHIEPIRALADAAHARGAFLYADIIQAAGIVPVDVREMGIDFAACSSYKWLLGPHGAGFLYVRQEHQGTALRDRLFPGHVRHNYQPWVDAPVQAAGDFMVKPSVDAQRYQTGHVSYQGYACLHETLQLLESIGVERLLQHSHQLARRLRAQVKSERVSCITPETAQTPIVSFLVSSPEQLRARMAADQIVASMSGRRLRVSPALYNNEEDVDRLAAVLNDV